MDIYYLIFNNYNSKELFLIKNISKEFNIMITNLIINKIKLKAFFITIKNNTIFPKIINNKKINIFKKKNKNRENNEIILFK